MNEWECQPFRLRLRVSWNLSKWLFFALTHERYQCPLVREIKFRFSCRQLTISQVHGEFLSTLEKCYTRSTIDWIVLFIYMCARVFCKTPIITFAPHLVIDYVVKYIQTLMSLYPNSCSRFHLIITVSCFLDTLRALHLNCIDYERARKQKHGCGLMVVMEALNLCYWDSTRYTVADFGICFQLPRIIIFHKIDTVWL